MIINPGLRTEARYPTRAESRRTKTFEENRERLLAAMRQEIPRFAPHDALGRKVHMRMGDHKLTEWTCGDGKRVRVSEMNDSHLFYAIAKAFRQEYPDARTREVGIDALKAEALRRLVGAL